jgi:hypothetical protein
MNHQRARGFVSFQSRLSRAGIMGFLVLGVGCEKTEIHAYRVPAETEVRSVAREQAPEGAVRWTLPSSWREVETTVQMRIATLVTDGGLEVAVTAFPGDVGGLLANVNRWRGQVGLEPTDEQGAEAAIKRLDDFEVIVVDVTGDQQRLVGTMISVGDGKTWFVKAVGDVDAVEAIKSDLIAFSKSFHIHGGEPGAENARPSETVSAPDMTPADTAREQWQPPEQWKTDPNASQILSAAFFADDGARITLIALGGQGGGLLDNINRWRGQVGIPAVASLEDQAVKELGNGAVIVDLVSEDGSNRIVSGIVPSGAQTLFFKLTGSSSQVDAEMERFEEFVNQVGLGKRGDS